MIAEGTVPELTGNPVSLIGPFLAEGRERAGTQGGGSRESRDSFSGGGRSRISGGEMFAEGRIHLSTGAIHTVRPLEAEFPKGRLTAVTGVSGSGKTTLILESLIPALEAHIAGKKLPEHVKSVEAEGIGRVKLIDATPIGINVRSTVATYANVHDELRKIYARTPDAKALGYRRAISPTIPEGFAVPCATGRASSAWTCSFCRMWRFPAPSAAAPGTRRRRSGSGITEKLCRITRDLVFNTALPACADLKLVSQRLQVLKSLGLGYLTLGEETPSLSGGEAQRLKLASEMGRAQSDSVFVFDEPTIGLHPLDVRTLLGVFRTLIENGATVIVIEHDLDVIRNADYVIDMGPGGGDEGGRIVAAGTPEEIRMTPESVTGRYL